MRLRRCYAKIVSVGSRGFEPLRPEGLPVFKTGALNLSCQLPTIRRTAAPGATTPVGVVGRLTFIKRIAFAEVVSMINRIIHRGVTLASVGAKSIRTRRAIGFALHAYLMRIIVDVKYLRLDL